MKKIIYFSYIAFLIIFAIFSYIFVDPNLFYLGDVYSGFAFSSRFLSTVFYILFVIIFFVFYGAFIYLGVKKKIKTKDVFMLLGATVIILLFSYPTMLSHDIFNYLATSRVLFFYHENPYVIMPIEFTGEPLLAFTHAANKLALYGPLWICLTGVPHLLGFGNFIVTLLNFKIFVSIFYLFAIFLVWKISKSKINLILFAFNPLVVTETLVSGHNDIVMISLVLFSFFLLARKKMFLGILFFILSVSIKYATILLIPILFYIFFKLIKNNVIDWAKVYFYSSLLMIFAFLLSPIREEIYPWYAIWFLSFSFLLPSRKTLVYISIAFSFGLLFRYVPFMFSGTHAGLTPLIKTTVTFLPAFLVGLYLVAKNKIWEKISFQ